MAYLTSEDAEAAFYAAFASADLEAMRDVLAMDDDCVCIHPGGERILGSRAVLRSWAAIFTGNGSLGVEPTNQVVHASDLLAVHHVIETLRFGSNLERSATVTATNVYRRDERGWRMVAHCAAPGQALRATGVMH